LIEPSLNFTDAPAHRRGVFMCAVSLPLDHLTAPD
jgi:hypothetical protein